MSTEATEATEAADTAADLEQNTAADLEQNTAADLEQNTAADLEQNVESWSELPASARATLRAARERGSVVCYSRRQDRWVPMSLEMKFLGFSTYRTRRGFDKQLTQSKAAPEKTRRTQRPTRPPRVKPTRPASPRAQAETRIAAHVTASTSSLAEARAACEDLLDESAEWAGQDGTVSTRMQHLLDTAKKSNTSPTALLAAAVVDRAVELFASDVTEDEHRSKTLGLVETAAMLHGFKAAEIYN